jgi:hypothetical protein
MKKPDEVEIYKRINRLKLKAGIPLSSNELGYINPDAIKQAQGAIDAKEAEYTHEIEAVLIKLDSTWKDLKADTSQAKKYVSRIYNYANNAKDLAETYNNELMKYFGLSLRDFCESFDINNKAHHIIVQAHIDVMWTAFKNKIMDEKSPLALELKTVIAKAIEKFK